MRYCICCISGAPPCRTPAYSLDLLLYAWHHRDFTDHIERQLAAFVASNEQRRSMQPMLRDERAFVSQLAPEYGVATVSRGQEPRRYVELLKVPSSFLPELVHLALRYIVQSGSWCWAVRRMRHRRLILTPQNTFVFARRIRPLHSKQGTLHSS